MKSFAYKLCPVDRGWETILTLTEVTEALSRRTGEPNPGDVERLRRGYESALKEAITLGFDGHFRQEPCVFWIPTEEDFPFGFVIKQEHHGITFVISPMRLEWLER